MKNDEKYATYRKMVDDRIQDMLKERYSNRKIFVEAISGGKRVRPVFTMMIADVFGGDVGMALNVGIIAEIVHASSLILDDIIDADLERRGKPTMHVKYGITKAYIAGITMPSWGINLASNYPQYNMAKMVSDTWLTLCDGVELEIDTILDMPAINLYYKIIDKKTAVLFGLAAKMGAISCFFEDDLVVRFGAAGEHIGRAYQIADDLCDLANMTANSKIGSEFLLLRAGDLGDAIKGFVGDLITGGMSIRAGLDNIKKFVGDDVSPLLFGMIRQELREAGEILADEGLDDKKVDDIIFFAKYLIDLMLQEGGMLFE